MIQIRESLEIELVESLRKKYLGRGLDDLDSFSYHQVLTVDGHPLGTARFYRSGSDVVIDSIAAEPALPPGYREMLSRSMIAHALEVGCGRVVVEDDRDYYLLMGFTFDGVRYAADAKRIEFPGCCGKKEERE